MQIFDGQYSGAALQAFVHGLPSQVLVEQILTAHGIERIDKDQWYPLETARSIYRMVGQRVGKQTLRTMGLQVAKTAFFPPMLTDIKDMMMSLNEAYQLNVRGADVGYIECSIDDEHSATVTTASPFPCALSLGVFEGCWKRFHATAIIEHGLGGCLDEGGASCTYRITW